ncbi:MAG: hypothetical protein ABFR50_07955 [Candidatus Fermentibacteria bacterium]
MIPGILTALLLISSMDTVSTSLGLPVTIDYSIPENCMPLPLDPTDDFILLGQQADRITIIPIALDTLVLPPMRALSDSVEIMFSPPLVVVARTMTDTTWIVPLFPAPLLHTIPPGLPRDYLQRHCFWERWGRPSSNRWLLPLILSAALIISALLIWIIHRRNSRLQTADISTVSDISTSPLAEVRALLDSKAFAEGRWPEYYKDIDHLFRNTLDAKFDISNRAFTWRQIRTQLNREKNTGDLLADATELSREITLQRYAAWGGSRERARRFTLILLKLREEWHRQ